MKRIEDQSRWRLLAIGFLPAVFLTACAVGPNYKQPQMPVANSFANAPTNIVSPDEATLATWWKGFNDARLDRLVDRAITNNHDLRIATANLKEARALRRLTKFDLAPPLAYRGPEARDTEALRAWLPATLAGPSATRSATWR